MSLRALPKGLLPPVSLIRGSVFRLSSSPRIPRGVRLSSSMPVAEASFWRSMIPKPLRSSGEPKEKKPRSNEWNPATFFIVIFLLIGSMSINLLSVKQDHTAFVRQSEARIGILREVVERLQRGEEVDVERVLGTGDPEKELEWEEGTTFTSEASRTLIGETRETLRLTRRFSSPEGSRTRRSHSDITEKASRGCCIKPRTLDVIVLLPD